MFKIDIFTFTKDYDGFWLEILNIDTYGGFDRSLFMIGKNCHFWFLELFFIRITPR